MSDQGKGTRSPRRAIKSRGVGYWHFNKKFGWIYRGWPKPRGKGRTPGERITQQQLSAAAYITKRANSWEMDFAKSQVGDGPWTWKDYYVSTLYGRTLEFTGPDGTVYRSARIVSAEAQQLLDSITNVPGNMLVRLDSGWAALVKGTDGQVLTVRSDSVPPVWQTFNVPVGVQGPTYQYAYVGNSEETDSQACLGEVFKFDADLQLWSLSQQLQPTDTGTYRVGFAPFDSGTNQMTADPIYGLEEEIIGSGAQVWTQSLFQEAIYITKGQEYIAFVNRTDAGDTGPCRVVYQTTNSWGPYIVPRTRTNSAARLAKVNPTTSDVWSRLNGFYGQVMVYSDHTS